MKARKYNYLLLVCMTSNVYSITVIQAVRLSSECLRRPHFSLKNVKKYLVSVSDDRHVVLGYSIVVMESFLFVLKVKLWERRGLEDVVTFPSLCFLDLLRSNLGEC